MTDTAGRCRFFVKAAGEWKGDATQQSKAVQHSALPAVAKTPKATKTIQRPPKRTDATFTAADVERYRPRIEKGQWILSEIDLKWIADGCYIMGCGGGGDPQHTYLQLREMVRKGAVIRIVDIDSLADDEMVGWGGCMGSPEVASERMLGEE
jgi:hypothetical protein